MGGYEATLIVCALQSFLFAVVDCGDSVTDLLDNIMSNSSHWKVMVQSLVQLIVILVLESIVTIIFEALLQELLIDDLRVRCFLSQDR